MGIGKKIKSARLAHNLTQSELGEKVGLQKSAISKIERGETRNIKLDTWHIIAHVLELDPGELTNEEPITTQKGTVLPRVYEQVRAIDEAKNKSTIIEMDGESHTLVELYSELNNENKDRLLVYLQEMLTDQHVQTLARLNRLKHMKKE